MFMESFIVLDCANIDQLPRLDVLWADKTGCARLKVMSQEIQFGDGNNTYSFTHERKVPFVF